MPKLLSVEDAAQLLGGISSWTVRRWLTLGRLTRVKVGSRTMVLEQELVAMAQPETPDQAAARNSKRDRRGKK
ncbi:MAG TPA: helix-turn-helix domain-containing protein [Terriglobales bacterium]|nr:helix-turn-helix domain-containing protein [Terriglobales bacterium]